MNIKHFYSQTHVRMQLHRAINMHINQNLGASDIVLSLSA